MWLYLCYLLLAVGAAEAGKNDTFLNAFWLGSGVNVL